MREGEIYLRECRIGSAREDAEPGVMSTRNSVSQMAFGS